MSWDPEVQAKQVAVNTTSCARVSWGHIEKTIDTGYQSQDQSFQLVEAVF